MKTTETTPNFTKASALFGHVDEASAYVVDDYPYGFRLRTSIRYWIQTTKHGDRFVSQTLNPKTGSWNKPKTSTYAPVGAMYLDDQGHVAWTAVQEFSDDAWLAHFTKIAGAHLSGTQRRALARVVALKRVFEHVTFTVSERTATESERVAQPETERRINRAIAIETQSAIGELAQGITPCEENVSR